VGAIAITPDGKAAYVTGAGAVTPINLVTNTAGQPIQIGTESSEMAIAITPDGKTAYVTNSATDTVTPVNLATSTPGKPIEVAPLSALQDPEPGSVIAIVR
jgi:DNA-binding beta-propeller fold protein YncE